MGDDDACCELGPDVRGADERLHDVGQAGEHRQPQQDRLRAPLFERLIDETEDHNAQYPSHEPMQVVQAYRAAAAGGQAAVTKRPAATGQRCVGAADV